MQKIVINACFGGFGLSDAAILMYAKLKGITLYPELDKYGSTVYYTEPPTNDSSNREFLYDRDIERDDPDLVEVVEALGAAASGRFAELKVVAIPDGVEWQVEEYDGNEHIAQKHQTWS